MDDFNAETPDPVDFGAALDYSTPDPLSQNRVFDCKRAEPDPRLARYAVPPIHLDLLPASVDLRPYMPPVYDQGELGSCTGNAWAGLVQYLRKHNRPPLEDWVPSRLFIYFDERLVEGNPSQDAGAAISDGAKVLASQGVCPESMWPYDVSRFAVRPPQSAYAEAATHKVIQPTPLDNTKIHDLKSCLALGSPFVFGFTVYQSFESRAVVKTGMVPMPQRGERQLGGHAVMGCGYSDKLQAFLVRNSWGTAFGLAGYCWFPYQYLSSSRLASDFWMARAAT